MVTIILPISREYYLQRIFTQLEMLICDREQTNIITYVDGDVQLYATARNFTENSKFAQRLCVYRKRGIANVGSVWRRRQRIADIHNEMKEYLQKAEHVFLIEDDTLFPTNALVKLLSMIDGRNDVGLASGVEIGRWGFNHIGAWKADDIYEPKMISSMPMGVGVTEVDATGLYCCIVKFDNYMKHKFEPFEDILGPDVQFGFTMRQIGLKNYIDYSIKCSHLTKKETIDFNRPIDIVTLEKLANNKWSQKGVQS